LKSLRLILSDPKYFAPAWVFASVNIMTGTWVLYLPHIKTKFGLNDGEVGVALFCLAFGLLISIPFAPILNQKIGVGQASKYGVLFYALSFNLPLLVGSYLMLCLSLVLTGIFSGFTDISINALVSTIERKGGRSFMSAAHGFFSLGGFIGAGVGSVLLLIYATPAWHMGTISAFILLSNWYLSRYYENVTERDRTRPDTKVNFKAVRPLLAIALVGFIIMFNEGAVEHWSNLFLFDVVQATESQAGAGFIAFSLCMTLGRFLGDGISNRLGAIPTIVAGTTIAFISYAFVVSATFYVAVFGFGILGLGLSVVVPEIFRLAGNTEGVTAAVGISIVSGFGFVGFMIGPVLLGFISNWASLTWSFGFLASMILVALGLMQFGMQRRV